MTNRGPNTIRSARKRRTYIAPGSGTAWSGGSFIIFILALVVVALAIAYGING